MISANEFWLNLHRLMEAYEAEGLTSDERAANIVAEFQLLPLTTQRQLLADLLKLSTRCPDLYPMIVAAANEAEAEAASQQELDAG
ncbi:MAG TPA: hypothetical protein VFB80_18305 [Pirellulaceae bacterium]|nr:hypothetical protein [Pirellulaceae bacterium]